jgi:hypothetical protein
MQRQHNLYLIAKINIHDGYFGHKKCQTRHAFLAFKPCARDAFALQLPEAGTVNLSPRDSTSSSNRIKIRLARLYVKHMLMVNA